MMMGHLFVTRGASSQACDNKHSGITAHFLCTMAEGWSLYVYCWSLCQDDKKIVQRPCKCAIVQREDGCEASRDHWSCHHPLLLTEGGLRVRKIFFKHLLSTNSFENVSYDDMMMMVTTVWNLFTITLSCFFPRLNKCFLLQSDGEDELKKRQLMELAIINGTYRDSSSKNSSRKSTNVDWMDVEIIKCKMCARKLEEGSRWFFGWLVLLKEGRMKWKRKGETFFAETAGINE